MNDLLSIIVPVYNVEKYLEKCLNSLVKQTYKNIEIIVVNDGSPDDSQVIIDEFIKKYPKLIFGYKKENGGLSDARNYGIKKAKGKYIMFVDSDDYVEYDYCEYLYNLIKNNNADVACCSYCINDELKDYEETINIITNENIFYSYVYEPYIKSCVLNKIYKKSLIKNILFDNVRITEDIIFNSRVLPKAKKIVCSNLQKYHYNTLNVSLTRSSLNLEKIKGEVYAHKLQFKLAKSNNEGKKVLSKVILNTFNALYVYYLQINKNTDLIIKKYIKKEILDCTRKYKLYKRDNGFSKKGYIKMLLISYFFNIYYQFYNLIRKTI